MERAEDECEDEQRREEQEQREREQDEAESYCGDGVVDWGAEFCDDGNIRDGDGCSSRCERESRCGNGRVEQGETVNNMEDCITRKMVAVGLKNEDLHRSDLKRLGLLSSNGSYSP